MYQQSLIFISSFSFIAYAMNSFFSKRMVVEFSRWGMAKLRILIASFQMLGGFGLLLGIYNLYLLCLASFFLMFMMLIAIVVRIRVNDSLVKTLPAVAYALLNFIIFYRAFAKINVSIFFNLF